MLNLNAKKLTRLAIVLGAIILIMSTVATVAAFADTDKGASSNATQTVTAQDSGDGYIAEASGKADDNTTGLKSIAAGIAIGFAACGGGIGMGISGGKEAVGISRQPEADGKIRTNFMLSLVFIETAIIYALLVVILIIFVL
jgi:F-type H+-transporting ATPase subunit c